MKFSIPLSRRRISGDYSSSITKPKYQMPKALSKGSSVLSALLLLLLLILGNDKLPKIHLVSSHMWNYKAFINMHIRVNCCVPF